MDILERLRQADPISTQRLNGSSLLGDAADEIERLRTLLVRWLNGGDGTLAQDSRRAINPPTMTKTAL